MRVRRLIVENFRGIEFLDWRLDSRLVALVGAGDTTKTTVLEALTSVLTNRFSLNFTDADFFGCDTSKPIRIRAAVTELPKVLLEQRNFGDHLSGIDADGRLQHDPVSGSEVCLVVSLTVDETLEPVWSVVRPAEEQDEDAELEEFDDDEATRISAAQRAHLGCFRVGDYVDVHLRWSKGSALSALTTSRTTATNAVVDAQRQARQAVTLLQGTPLHKAAELARRAVIKLGGTSFGTLRPGLDPTAGSSTATLVLHDGVVPLTGFGLGTRRLTSLAIQQNAIVGGAIVAIDELESGLDPHRLIHLLRYLRGRTEEHDLQVFFTTHSPIVVQNLAVDEAHLVRSEEGTTTVEAVPADLSEADTDTAQSLFRSKPSAILGRRVIVGEGATETGLLRRLLERWDVSDGDDGNVTAVAAGAVVTNGDGDSHAPKRARSFAQLGYPTMLVVDNDTTGNAKALAKATQLGVEVVQWPTGMALEDAIVEALSVEGLQAVVDLAVDEIGEASVLASLSPWLTSAPDAPSIEDMIEADDEDTVRAAVAAAAKGLTDLAGAKADSRAWFKREDRGERLADVLIEYWSDLEDSSLGEGLQEIREFSVRGVPPVEEPEAESDD